MVRALCLFDGGSTRGRGREYPCTGPLTFWFKPLSAFGLLVLTTFISEFTWVSQADPPWPPTALAQQSTSSLTRSPATVLSVGEVRWPKSLHHRITPVARLGRVPVVARPGYVQVVKRSRTDTSAASCSRRQD